MEIQGHLAPIQIASGPLKRCSFWLSPAKSASNTRRPGSQKRPKKELSG